MPIVMYFLRDENGSECQCGSEALGGSIPCALGKRREPTRERKGLAPVSPEVAALVVLDEAQVEPRDEPSELDLCA